MARQSSRTLVWVAAGAFALIVGLWLVPAAMAGQHLNGWLAGLAGCVAALTFAMAARRAWPKSERLELVHETHSRGDFMEKNRKAVPMVERNEAADRRAEALPEQPQEHIIRGYGAVNPEEGPLDENRPR